MASYISSWLIVERVREMIPLVILCIAVPLIVLSAVASSQKGKESR